LDDPWASSVVALGDSALAFETPHLVDPARVSVDFSMEKHV
jgi:hypothetical protein